MKRYLKDNDLILADELSLATAVDPIVSGVSSIELHDTLSGIDIVCQADTDVVVPDSKTLTITMTHSDDDTTFVALPYGESSGMTVTSSGSATTIPKGTELFRFNADQRLEDYFYFKPAITSDATNTGSISIFGKIRRS